MSRSRGGINGEAKRSGGGTYRGSHPAQEIGALDHAVESSSGREDADRRWTALPGGDDGDPGAADSSSESSASTTDDDDDVPSPRTEFRALARRASRMTIGDIEAGAVAAWVSALDVMECLSSDNDDDEYDHDDDVELHTTSPEAPLWAPRTSFRRPTAAIVG